MEALHHFVTKVYFYLSVGSVYCGPHFLLNFLYQCSKVEPQCLFSELKPYGLAN